MLLTYCIFLICLPSQYKKFIHISLLQQPKISKKTITNPPMQIPSVLASISRQLICFFMCLFIFCFLFIKLIAFITGFHLMGVALILYGFYRLLKEVGIFALYPGCFNFIKSDYQLRGSQRLAQIVVKNNQELFGLFQRCQQYPDTAYLTPNFYWQYVSDMIKLLSKFQPTLSTKKKQLLTIYRNMQTTLKKPINLSQLSISCEQFLQNPQEIRERIQKKYGNINQLKLYASHFRQEMTPYIMQLNGCLHGFHPPRQAGAFKLMMYKLYTEKLYEIRFGYIYWESRFDYSIHLVENQSNGVIQCVVVNPKNNAPQTNQCVIISLPNGAYLQYFALQSQYMEMYFKLGYQIVLWNYRGYGQSTGTPSISASIQDAQAVYNYCRLALKLNPQIAHGYSIGGPPAAVLALTNQLKAVVIDRSFCNFVNIAHEISPILAKLARIVMKSDSNVNISEVFLRTRNCRKILIWSAVDEVISNGSSLKLGILNKLFKEAQVREDHDFQPNSPTALIQQNQLHERQVFIEKNKGQKKVANKKQSKNRYKNWLDIFISFFQTVNTLYEIQKIQVFTKQSTNSNNSLVEQIPIETELVNISTQRQEMSKQLINKFWEIIEHVDGGGTTIKFLKELAMGGIDKHDQMCLEVRSFVLGLIYFGCCYHQSGSLNVDNLDNWPETIAILSKVQEKLTSFINENSSEHALKIVEYFKQVNRAFKQIRLYLEKINKNKDRSLGIILPTDSGHNGELASIELKYLQTALTLQNQNGRKNRNQLKMSEK